MKECILPLAIQTKAIIITEGINSCSLATTIGSMASDIFKQTTGSELPFYLLTIVSEEDIGYNSLNFEDTFAYNLKSNSKYWKKNCVTK